MALASSAESRRISAPQVLDERFVDGVRRNADRVVAVGYLTAELRFPVASQRLGNGVQVDHHLDGVAGVFVAGLGVDDDAVILTAGDDVGPAGQRRRFAAEFKPVLSLDVDVEAGLPSWPCAR